MAMKYGSREAMRIASDEAQAVVLTPAIQQLSRTTGTWAKLFVTKPLKNLNPYDVFPNSGSMRKIFADSLGGAGRSVYPGLSPCSMGSANQMVG
jgi:hypothetical protein